MGAGRVVTGKLEQDADGTWHEVGGPRARSSAHGNVNARHDWTDVDRVLVLAAMSEDGRSDREMLGRIARVLPASVSSIDMTLSNWRYALGFGSGLHGRGCDNLSVLARRGIERLRREAADELARREARR